ncbi:hypothetical protein D3C73_1615790 [compost metagenome]
MQRAADAQLDMHRLLAAPHRRIVDDVVMDEGRGVNEFRGGCKPPYLLRIGFGAEAAANDDH